MATERTVYLSYPNGAVAHGHRERQVSVPWCVVHDEPTYGEQQCVGGQIAIAENYQYESQHCDVQDGVVWKVVES